MKTKSEKILIGAILIIVLFVYKCPIKFIFGISCPGCGMSRAFYSVLEFKFERAFYYHPLWPLVLIVILLVGIDLLKIHKFKDKTKKIFIKVVCVIFIAVYVIRLIMQVEVIQPDFKESLIYHIYNIIN